MQSPNNKGLTIRAKRPAHIPSSHSGGFMMPPYSTLTGEKVPNPVKVDGEVDNHAPMGDGREPEH